LSDASTPWATRSSSDPSARLDHEQTASYPLTAAAYFRVSFYHGFAEPLLRGYFPGMPCYEHFVARQKSVFVPLVFFLHSHLGTKTGLYYIDATALATIIASTGTRSLPIWSSAARWAGSSASSCTSSSTTVMRSSP
jgi:hypothetical protein